jgi:hypothetical protein
MTTHYYTQLDQLDLAETTKEKESFAKLEGRVRALEAIFLQLLGENPKVVADAKARLRDEFKSSTDEWYRMWAKLKGDAPYDEHAEGALDHLAYKITNMDGGE